MTHGGLFEGIGGFSLGARLAGIKTKWVCELDPFRKGLLRKNFKGISVYGNIVKLSYPPRLILSQEDFHAKIYHSLEILMASLEQKADCGMNTLELFTKSVPGISLLKIVCSLPIKDWSISYMTFPKQGMMHNGKIYQLHNLATPIKGSASLSLPTPLKTDGTKSGNFKCFKKLLAYLKDHTDRLYYQCRLNGLDGIQTMMIYEAIMGFPLNWTEEESLQLEMPLYPK